MWSEAHMTPLSCYISQKRLVVFFRYTSSITRRKYLVLHERIQPITRPRLCEWRPRKHRYQETKLCMYACMFGWMDGWMNGGAWLVDKETSWYAVRPTQSKNNHWNTACVTHIGVADIIVVIHGTLTRYAKLWVAQALVIPGTLSRHHGLATPTCISHARIAN